MKQLAIYSLILMMLVLTGCPVLTKNSIDDGSYDVPKWMAGKWQAFDKEGKAKDIYFLEKGEKKGNMKCYDDDGNGKADQGKMHQVILSTVGSRTFLCYYTPEDDVSDEGYYLFELRKVSNKEFQLAGIKEHAIDYHATQAAIVKYLEQNKDNDGIFDPAEVSTYKKL